ncbi:sensor histidine kinase [Saccharicrinis sp. 156]|uniref:sensor histidine kinase n=1 Tax=Saccharicrinis sp. 156 TaxID=3417574 RepID=UPI003D339EA2
MIRFNKIRVQLQLTMGLLIVFTIGALGIFHFNTVKRSLLNDYREKHFYTVLEASKSSFQSILQKAIETSELLAEDPTIVSWFKGKEKDDDLKQLALQRLDYLYKNYKYSTVFAVSNLTNNYWKEGFELMDVISEEDSDDCWFFEGLENKIKTTLNFDYNRELNKTVLFVNVLMGDLEDPLGIAGVGVNPSVLIDEFNKHKISENTILWLADEKGKVLISERVDQINKPLQDYLPEQVVHNIIENGNASVISEAVINNKKVEVAFMPIATTRYKLVVMVPDEELVPVLRLIEQQTLMFSVVFLLITLVVVSILSRTITLPLLRLKVQSESLAEGRLDYEPDPALIKRVDEIGVLAKTFDGMRKQLSEDIIEMNKLNERLVNEKNHLKETNQQLNKALASASESERLTQSFLANISHEIRTPMNSIMGFSELIEVTEVGSNDYKQYASLVVKSGQQLLSILDSIINLSKIESGVLKPSWGRINISVLVKETYEIYHVLAKNRGLKMVLSLERNEKDLEIHTDAILLQQVLNNLIQNAIKYTNAGFVKIGCYEKEDQLIIYVEDTGIGMSLKDMEYIFEPFRQIDNIHSKKTVGAGLGLAIVDKIAKILGGTIEVSSQPKKGSRFTVKLPRS